MDKKLLEALNGVTNSLSVLAKLMGDKKKAESEVGSAIQNASIGNQIKNIEKVLNDVKKDTSEILSKQKEILAIQKSNNQNNSIGGFDFSNKEEIKKGASTIILMAGSILAIGTAFKIVGDVDFASVMALSLSLPIMAHSMSTIAEIKEINTKNMLRITGGMLVMSSALTLSSHILSKASIVSPTQFLTILGISSAFSIMAIGVSELTDKNIKFSNMLKIPAMMILLSGAISASSYLLSSVVPLTIPQALTALAIGGVFAVLSYSIKGITKNINNITPDELITLPAIMLGLSTAIALSSGILALVQPIKSVEQFLTIIGIASAFVPLAYAAKPIVNATKDIGVKDIAILPLLMVALSGAVVGSSYILQNVQTIQAGTLLNVVLQAATLSAISLSLYPAIKLFGNANVLKNLAISIVALPLIATSIMASSHILAMGDYSTYPDLGWSAGVGASMITFGLSALALGTVITATGGIGAIAIATGLLSTVAIAGAISVSSHILASGNYSNSPSVGWAVSTSLLLTTFGAGALTLGTMITATFGLGSKLLQEGNNAVLSIANTIVLASHILAKGRYTNSINKDWAESVSMSLGAFAPIYAILMADKLIDLFTFGQGGVSVDDFTRAIIVISQGILQAGETLSKGSGHWTNAPTKEWAEGVGTAIGAFAPVFKILYEQDIIDLFFGSKGVSVYDMKNTIDIITQGIIQSATSFSTAGINWKNTDGSAPTKEWAEGVAQSIGAFSKIYELGKGFFNVDANDIRAFNIIIAGSGSSYSDNDFSIISTLIRMNRKIANEKFIQNNPATGLIQILSEYVKFISDVSENDVSMKSISRTANSLGNSLLASANGAEKFAISVGKIADSISRLDTTKLNAFKEFTGVGIELANVNTQQFNTLMDAFNQRTHVMAEAFETSTFKNFVDKVGNFTSTITQSNTQSKMERDIDDLYNLLFDIRGFMAQMVQHSKTSADYANEQRFNTNSNIGSKRNKNV